MLICIVLSLCVSIFAHPACGRADFGLWANRTTRVIAPACYRTSGTCAEKIVSWKGVQGVGNLGIGNGNIGLIKPGYLKSALNEAGANASAAYDFGTDTLLPGNISAASVVTEGEPCSITINQPFPHIFMEDPVQAAVVYGKLLGLPLPDGRKVDVGIMCLGYEY